MSSDPEKGIEAVPPERDFRRDASSPVIVVDDRRNPRREALPWSRSNIRSMSAAHRPSEGTVTLFCSSLAESDPQCLALALMGVATAIDLGRRPIRLAAAGELPANRNEILLSSADATLCYAVEGGATDFAAGENRERPSALGVMRLAIPGAIGEALGEMIAKGRIRAALGRLNRLAFRHAEDNEWFAPTVDRLHAGYWTLLVPRGLTSIEASHVAGAVPASVGARAAYYRLDVAGVNLRFREAAHLLIGNMHSRESASERLKAYLTALRFPQGVPAGQTGSQVAVSLEELASHVDAIRGHAIQCERSWMLHWGTPGIDRLLGALNAQGAYYHLLLQCATGVRPPGNVTEIGFNLPRHGACVGDKSSKHFDGRSRSPVPRLLHDQASAIRQTADAALGVLRALGVSIDAVGGLRPERDNLPLYYEWRPRTQGIRISRMTPGTFELTLRRAGIPCASLYKAHENLVRHTLATWLHRRLPEQLIDEFLGHAHAGLELCGAWSSAGRIAFDGLERELDRLLGKVFGKALAMRVRP